MSKDTPNADARAAFVKLRKEENAMSDHPVSLAKDWTGKGFKDCHLNKQWQSFLEGWNAAKKPWNLGRKES